VEQDVTNQHDAAQRLLALAKKISELMSELLALNEPLDLALGAVHALIEARKHNYRDRKWPLPPRYYIKVRKLAEDLSRGRQLDDKPWLAGFYFNSALLRIAAVYHDVLKLHTGRRGYVRELLPLVSPPFDHGSLDKVHEEVNKLKHQPQGVGQGRGVRFEEAIAALGELIDFIEGRKADFPGQPRAGVVR
jgi:hypothetical protein